jgi:hypothetical protein
MTKFAHFKKLRIDADAIAEYVIEGIEGEPTLYLRSCSEHNPLFLNEILQRTKADPSLGEQKSIEDFTLEMLEETRQRDLEMFSTSIVAGWKQVYDAEGNEVPFSQEDCLDFLTAIPSDIFNGLRLFAMDADNFRGIGNAMEAEEIKEVAGN